MTYLDPGAMAEYKQGDHSAPPWLALPSARATVITADILAAAAAPLPPLLSPGLWVWLWNRGDPWERIDLPKFLAACARWSVRGVLPHSGTGGLDWLAAGALEKFRAQGLGVVGSLGILSADRICNVLEAPLDGCMLDWETYWDGRQSQAQAMVDAVLSRVPDARGHVTDCPWWAPLTTPGGHPSHPSAPTAQFGQLVSDRYVQAYGAPVDGRSASMLAWARSSTQYPSFRQPWLIRGAFQGYHRSVSDQVTVLMATSTDGASCCLWDYLEFDVSTMCALDCRTALVAQGYTGALAVQHFQAAHPPLVVDGIVGPRTCAALGVTAPPGVVWTHRGSSWP
jgi:hypothetical protein